jgi:DNA-binding MurR/RpiR family transcriptional regulator
VAEIADGLPPSQRRVAELVVRDPEAVAFGTVSSVAALAATSNPTVVRFAAQLGFDGFTALRDSVRDEVSDQLRSAVARVRRPPEGPLLQHALEIERANVEGTLKGLDGRHLAKAIALLADVDRRVWVLPSSQTMGAGSHLADDLQLCRPRVTLLEGSEFRVFTVLAGLRRGDVILSIDTQRHERWFVRAQRDAVKRGAVPIVITDRLPCSLDLTRGVAMTFACDTTSPFESQTGLVALGNLLVSGVVEALRASVAKRMDALEDIWVRGDLFDV